MIEANRYKLGIFITCGVVFFIGLFFLLGLFSKLFDKTLDVTTIFTESVQGLEVGAPVKLKGVTVGRVDRMRVRLRDNHVRVDMKITESGIFPITENAQSSAAFSSESINKEVAKGLRCRLELSGITGMKYVELNYFPPSAPIVAIKPPGEVIYIPSTPSLLSGISASLSETMARIASINYEKISSELTTTLISINKLFEDPKIQSTLQNLERVSSNLETTTVTISKTLNETAIKEVMAKVQTNLDSINSLSETIKKEIENAKISETTNDARNVFSKTSQNLDSVAELKNKLSESLDKLDDAVIAFSEFLDDINEDPSSILKGKQKAPILRNGD
jgi:ABC-type transporter Mla subunit MlaD